MRNTQIEVLDFGTTTLAKNTTYYSQPFLVSGVSLINFILTYTTTSGSSTDASAYFQFSNDSPQPHNNVPQVTSTPGIYIPVNWIQNSNNPAVAITSGATVAIAAGQDAVQTAAIWARVVIAVSNTGTAANIFLSSARSCGKAGGQV